MHRYNYTRITRALAGLFALHLAVPAAAEVPARQFERLDRGVVAVPASGGGNLVSWRLLATDPAGPAFDLYRDGKRLNATPLSATTNHLDVSGTASATYMVRTLRGGAETERSRPAGVWQAGYLSLPIQQPAGGTTASGPYTFMKRRMPRSPTSTATGNTRSSSSGTRPIRRTIRVPA